jgi:hypothetical protein
MLFDLECWIREKFDEN